MTIDIVAAKKTLQRLRVLAAFAWIITTALLAIPFYQWWKLGNVPLNTTFVVLTVANVILIAISTKLTTRIKFLRYQIAYFSVHRGE